MSTINYTYNVIVDRFRQFAEGHFQLRRFTHGEISQADLEKEAEWPWLHVKPRAINYSPGTRAFSFEIFISDLPRDKEDKTGYQAESITDCSLIFQDLINEIYLGNMFGDQVVLTRPVNSEPFVEQYTHTLTGVTGTIELNLDYDWSACSIPASWNYNTPTDSPSDGWGALQFIESLDQNGVFVSLVNDEETPGNSYYYGTNASGVKGWYATEAGGLTCEDLPDCAVIISITDDIIALQTDVALKANTADLGATAFSNDYNDLDNLPTIPPAQVNSDWNATSGVAEILNKPTIPAAQIQSDWTQSNNAALDYIKNKPTLTNGTVTSVGLTMPSAFSVANSPITSSGDIAVTGAGTVSQYVRGDGSLANFPSSTGGGSSLAFYLNGSVAQGTIGGVAFKEMDRTPILGAGTDFTINANGYIQSFITDANVPNLLEIPAGNWNFETYFSASSGGGSPSFYVELYKWNGATLSLIASNSATPEGITNGTAIDAYFSALAVPQTTLAATDRLAIRIYVTHSGRTITLHTENSHLCQVITTFSTGLTALNGLTAQVQNFATGTSGTDFAISSATSTHTFNLPTASAANRGALSSADWSTFNGKQDALGFTAENTANKQNSLAIDGTGVKFPTVDAVNTQSMIDKGKRMVSFFTDFYGNDLSRDGLISATSGGIISAQSLTAVPNRTNQIGVHALSTSTAATNWANHVSSGVTSMYLGNGAWVYETSINSSNLSVVTDRFRIVSGYGSASGLAAETDGVFFTYDEGGTLNGTAASPNWQCVTVANSVRTLTTTSTAVTNAAWNKLRIEINAAGTSAAFYVNGTLVATHTTNIPLGSASRFVVVKQGIYKTIGTTNRVMWVDYLGYENIQTTPRT